ncbi:hypothetical protein P43SY_011097 [Pythium insidiosum]|uniref:Uncharacterized protein n=1 Tax=Pythium insidiosum TaxID=114742 RepID=A0AAD5L8G0_PYTIN|nr:hypothetical protein P43SY_011097 [Pythium insidiosum]
MWPIAPSGRFKVAVRLPTPGAHSILLRLQLPSSSAGGDGDDASFSTANDLSRVLRVTFAPRTSSPHVIKLHYYQCVDSTEDTARAIDREARADSRVDMSLGRRRLAALVRRFAERLAMRRRIQLMALMLQTATAEMLRREGLPPQTFMLELSPEDNGLPVVHTVRAASLTCGMMRCFSSERVQSEIEQDLERHGLHDRTHAKHVLLNGASRFISRENRAEGQFADYNDVISSIGTCTMFTWPQRVSDITRCALDTTEIDTSVEYDDSWDSYAQHARCGNLSVAMSRLLITIGRMLGLPIALSGVMDDETEAFDLLRVFSVFEPDASAFKPVCSAAPDSPQKLVVNHELVTEVQDLGGAHWNRVQRCRQ